MPKMDQALLDALQLYQRTFDTGFPLMQANGGKEKIIEQIMICTTNQKTAEEMWPDQYGACDGKYF